MSDTPKTLPEIRARAVQLATTIAELSGGAFGAKVRWMVCTKRELTRRIFDVAHSSSSGRTLIVWHFAQEVWAQSRGTPAWDEEWPGCDVAKFYAPLRELAQMGVFLYRAGKREITLIPPLHLLHGGS